MTDRLFIQLCALGARIQFSAESFRLKSKYSADARMGGQVRNKRVVSEIILWFTDMTEAKCYIKYQRNS